jgi:uncharacterized protein (TIGR03435 family)
MLVLYHAANSRKHGLASTLEILTLAVLLSPGFPNASAQSFSGTSLPPAFDVASLKPVQPSPPYPFDPGSIRHGTVTLTNATLSQCLRFALNINNDSQIAGPAWIKPSNPSLLFTIVAKAPPETTKDQVRLMMLNLLTERFNLKLHHEEREIRYVELTVDKRGLMLRESDPKSSAPGNEVHFGRIVWHGASMETLIILLKTFTSTPIVDSTGLKGSYDIKLEWTARPQPGEPAAAGVADPSASIAERPAFWDAVHEQLGLKAETRRGRMDVVVVDSADKMPRAN